MEGLSRNCREYYDGRDILMVIVGREEVKEVGKGGRSFKYCQKGWQLLRFEPTYLPKMEGVIYVSVLYFKFTWSTFLEIKLGKGG